MRVLITRYPASEDRLIVRPLLCRRCALRLQPAEPQPYSGTNAAVGDDTLETERSDSQPSQAGPYLTGSAQKY